MSRCMSCDTFLGRKDLHCHSSVYGSPDGYLCKNCSDTEEDEIEEAGTNNLPKLVERYKSEKRDYNPYDTDDPYGYGDKEG